MPGDHPTQLIGDDQPSQSAPPNPVDPAHPASEEAPRPVEIGGPKGLEPTRYGDWERAGRCVDF